MVHVLSSLDAKQGIKPTTRASYYRLLLPVIDLSIDDPSILEWAKRIPNPNTKRSTLIALRSIGYEVGGVAPKVTR